ncbi:MAG: UbiA family prenyltransferase [Mangrovicoccus sp.]|nr:UbiA family prenyltransferase [Mangrovicoccus sp.]
MLPEALSKYVALARFDHATKHVFILPGIALALLLRGTTTDQWVWNIAIGLISAICIASANYVINEWLDREFDAHHPVKSQRASVQHALNPVLVYAWYGLLGVLGLALAATINGLFFWVSVWFLAMGVIYNVEPIRSKDKAFVDVLSESINNPIRLLLGWAMIDPHSLPPVSLLLGYWMGGAFLMNAKRMSEYRDLTATVGRETLVLYRRSFRYYTENRLVSACLMYAMFCGSFIGIFLIKYRAEYIIFLPFLGLLFAIYFGLALRPESVAQAPEKLFQSNTLMIASFVTAGVFALTTVIDMPFLEELADQRFIILGEDPLTPPFEGSGGSGG